MYVQDFKLPGLLHGRSIHPSSISATLGNVDESSVAGMPTWSRSFATATTLESRAERVARHPGRRQLKVHWTDASTLPDQTQLPDWLRQQPTTEKQPSTAAMSAPAWPAPRKCSRRRYTQPYQKPCRDRPVVRRRRRAGPTRHTIYSSTQGVYPLRGAIAQFIGLPADSVHVVHMEGSGCYGHNGFDDAAGDAASAVAGRRQACPCPVDAPGRARVGAQGPTMVVHVRGTLATATQRQPPGTTRSGLRRTARGRVAGGQLLPGQLVDPPHPQPKTASAAAIATRPPTTHLPTIASRALVSPASPLRVRRLCAASGAMANTFANESFMDELAFQAGIDPLAFRLAHTDDPRAQAVFQAAADRFGWQARTAPSHSNAGQGLAFAQYENNETYVATMVDVTVDPQSGQVSLGRVVVAHDCGLIVNPDGLTNQIEGNVIQSASRTLLEQVTFDDAKMTSVDWRIVPDFALQQACRLLTSCFSNHPDTDRHRAHYYPNNRRWGAGEITTLTTPPAYRRRYLGQVERPGPG